MTFTKNSIELKEVYSKYMTRNYDSQSPDSKYGFTSDIKFVHADITEFEWTHGDFILINSTWFDRDLMAKIYEKSKGWKEGTWLMIITKKLPVNEEWELILQTKKTMSWSEATINLYKKIK